jgi:peptidoglycan/LPS O-acetylase OafA/YrhL
LFGGYLHFDFSGTVGLCMFFLITGFVVAKSFRELGLAAIFPWHRVLLIMPAFILCVLIAYSREAMPAWGIALVSTSMS